jgi:hypothetical protein
MAIAVALVTVGLLALHQYRAVVEPRGRNPARFPDASPRIG